MPCFQLLWLAFLLSRHSRNLDFVQLVVEFLIEAEHICLADILAHGLLLQHIASLHRKLPSTNLHNHKTLVRKHDDFDLMALVYEAARPEVDAASEACSTAHEQCMLTAGHAPQLLHVTCFVSRC